MNVNSLQVKFGNPNSKKYVWNDLEVQLGFNDVLIGRKETTKWGIECNEDSENENTSCQFSKVIV